MTAQEAKDIALNNQLSDLYSILDDIATEAHRGNMSMFYYDNINSQALEKLKSLGYKIERTFDRGETFYKITWI